MHIPQNFLPRSRQKLLRSAPGQSFPAVAVMPHAAKVLKQVMVNTQGYSVNDIIHILMAEGGQA
ncbi:hypothetical protein PO726_004616 [Escherichia coli]|nr:hypothetical protein [Escherichia coli]